MHFLLTKTVFSVTRFVLKYCTLWPEGLNFQAVLVGHVCNKTRAAEKLKTMRAACIKNYMIKIDQIKSSNRQTTQCVF